MPERTSRQALDAAVAEVRARIEAEAPVVLDSTHISTLEFVDLADLERHAVDAKS